MHKGWVFEESYDHINYGNDFKNIPSQNVNAKLKFIVVEPWFEIIILLNNVELSKSGK